MALRKSVLLDSKVTVQHWWVWSWNVDVSTQACDVTLARFTSKADRVAGAKPVDFVQYRLKDATFPFDFTVNQKPIKQIEEMLATFPEFSGAVTE